MNFNLILPEILLSLGILITFLLDMFLGKKAFRFNIFIAGITPLFALLALFFVEYPALTLFDTIYTDALNLFGKGVIYILSSMVIFGVYSYLEKKDSVYGEIPYLILSSTLGLSFLLSSNNLASVFMSLELSSITVYVLVGLLRKDYMAKEGAFKYLVMGSLATAMFGMGSAFYYASTGSFSIKPYTEPNTLFTLSMFFLLSAIALKISAVPFHMWTPDAYESSPTPITAYISTVPKVALYFLLVKFALIFSHIKVWLVFTSFLALLSMFYANFSAYAQISVKRLLAYSSIAHAGYFLLGITSAQKELLNALLFYVIVYSFATVGAFILLAVLEKREGFTHHILDYRGLAKDHPIIASSLAFLLFAFIGIPPMALFVGKLGIFMGLVNSNLLPLALAFVLASILSAGYYLKVVVYMFLKDGEKKFNPTRVSFGESISIAASIIAVGTMGILPQVILNFIRW